MTGLLSETAIALQEPRAWLAITLLFLTLGILQVLIHHFKDPFDLRKWPAPSVAAFSNIWTAYHSRRLRRSRAIYDAHCRIGPIIRIQPRHISFADPQAIQDIYGHKSRIIKDTFYDTIAGDEHVNLVSTRSRELHAQKRRYISNAFSQRNIARMEPLMAEKVALLVKRLDKAATYHEVIDIREWLNYFTFDVISAMAFSNDPGFLRTGVPQSMCTSLDGRRQYTVNPIQAFQDSTIHVATIGQWPRLLKWTKPLTSWWHFSKQSDRFFDMCVHQIRERLKLQELDPGSEATKNDFFHHLTVNNQGESRRLPFGELVEEATVFLSAGSDTTASSMTNTLYLLLKHPETMAKLRKELQVFSDGLNHKDLPHGIFPYSPLSSLKYLRACLDEGLRHLPPTSIGLLRQTPPEGASIAGHWIKGGVTVSAPTYTIHHDLTLFKDPFVYRPERWIEGSEEERTNLKNYVIPFTLGRHACIGRNIAFMEQFVVLSTLVHRYDFSFEKEGFELDVLERINANPGPMPVRVTRRI